ncbi:MAG TPA: phenylacetate--CoA ligase family protein [Deltaproteobacteria bacterium]|nr:phenylacetate--CoA ligase family protein [Deltaproteobacteria bacterium]
MNQHPLEKIRKISREDLEQLKLERFQSTLNRVYQNVPFYHDRFKEFQLDPSDFTSLEHIRYLPFTTRKDLSNHYPYGMFAVPLRDILRIHTSVGSGANPTVVGYTSRDLANWKEIVARCLLASEVRPNDIIQVVFDYGLANWGRDFKDGAETIEASIIPMSYLPSDKQLLVMRDYRTSVLITTPSLALHLISTLEGLEFSAANLALKKCLLLGEQLNDSVRARIEDGLGVKVWGAYGLSEVPGPGIAFECRERQGFHVSEDHFILEIVDPDSGEPLPQGEFGELILTTITTKAFPLIRFRTGDKARLLNSTCPCGLNLSRLEFLPERTDEVVVIRGVKIHPVQIATAIRKRLNGTNPAYVVFVTKEEFLEVIELWISVDDNLFSDKIKNLEMVCETIKRDLQDTLGIGVKVKLVEPPTLEPYKEQLGKIVRG